MRSQELGTFVCSFLFLLTLILSWKNSFGSESTDSMEKYMGESECMFWEFRCKRSGCINMRKFCDGHVDCPDGSDEYINIKTFEITNTSHGTELACNNALNEVDKICSLPSTYACDSIQQCRGNVDESEKVCGTKNRYQKKCFYMSCMNSLVLNCPECKHMTGECDEQHCKYLGEDKEHHCASAIFKCKSGECLSAQQFCDGNLDCADGSDEITDMISDNTAGVLCNNKWNYAKRQCFLPQYHVCDGIDHCENRIDECGKGCSYSFICNNGKCITSGHNNSAPSYLKDGRDDCGDSSDELTSRVRNSLKMSFDCNDDDNTSLALEKFCDGVVDCPNKADEQISTNNIDKVPACRNRLVPQNISCSIPTHHLCDSFPMCVDNTDEASCEKGPNHFVCRNNVSVSRIGNVQCNFKDDCEDQSDECPPLSVCNTTFICLSDGKCLSFSKFCNGVQDCDDGSDELQDDGERFTCKNDHNAYHGKCVLPERYLCDGLDHCTNRADECKNFCENSFYCDSGQCIGRERFCDGTNDCKDSSDEKRTGHGFKCDVKRNSRGNVRTCVLPQSMLNDSVEDCADKSDFCFHENDQPCFRCLSHDLHIAANQVCDGTFDCPDLSDECLCEDLPFGNRLPQACENLCMGEETPSPSSDRPCDIGQLTCDFGNTVVSFFQVCDNTAQCEDGTDELDCTKNKSQQDIVTRPKNFECTLHRAKAVECDGIVECPDFSDECSRIPNGSTQKNGTQTDPQNAFECGAETMKICREIIEGYTGVYSCPNSYLYTNPEKICNGVEDCIGNRMTTRPPWPSSLPATWSDFSVDETDCKYRALCYKSRPRDLDLVSIPRDQVCDGFIDCEEEEDEAENTCGKLKPDRFYCETRRGSSSSSFNSEDKEVYSQKDPLFVSKRLMFDGKKDCWDGSDECPSSWIDDNPFSSRHRMIKNAILNVLIWAMAILAISGNAVVVCHTSLKLIKSRRSIPTVWNSGVVIGNKGDPRMLQSFYTFVCVRHALYVSYHITSTNGRGSTVERESKKILLTFDLMRQQGNIQVFFSKINFWLSMASTYQILLENSIPYLLAFSQNVETLSPMMKTNCVLVLNLAIADLLMGFYLFALAIQNSITSGKYCKVDAEWRTSQSCTALGTLAFTSIQCSVLILIILTTYRMLAVLKPFSADSVQTRYTGVLIFAAWFLSIILACLPRLASLEDYFTSAAWVSPSIDFFATNTPKKSTWYYFVKRLQVLEKHGSGLPTSISLTEDQGTMTWSAIREALNELYPKIWPQYKIKGYFSFYGSNSVCLPQMFVTVNDSGWGYSAAIMTFDLIAFLYILLSYLIIYHDAKRVVASNRNDDENRTMQARITRLVLTDFICWVPVCIIAFLSLAGVEISPLAYAFAAIVLLPINSALNPILYSNVINVIYNSCIKPGSAVIRRRLLISRQSFNRVRKRSTYSRTSMAVSMVSNDYIHSPEGAPMLSHETNSAISQNNASVATTTTRV